MTKEREEKLLRVLGRRQENLTVVMENVQDPHNISAVMRTCDAVGIQDIHILNTKIPRHKKFGTKSSSSALKWLTIHEHDDVKKCVGILREQQFKILTTHLADDAVSLYDIDLTQKIALVFGNEHGGVSDELRALADGNFIIPQMGIIQSLNISVACAVSIYEAYRQKEKAGHYATLSLSDARFNQLKEEWGFYRNEDVSLRSDD
jgi:tRNA (guanosine-2'-O-)-methyltransferase